MNHKVTKLMRTWPDRARKVSSFVPERLCHALSQLTGGLRRIFLAAKEHKDRRETGSFLCVPCVLSRLIRLVAAWPRCALRHGWRALLLSAVIGAHFVALAQQPVLTEYQQKAAWLFNVLKSTDWPAEAVGNKTTPALVLGILGHDPFGNIIDAMTNKVVAGKPIVIKRYKSVQEVQDCHVMFISASQNSALPQILDHLKNSSVITVGETAEFTRLGGMINLSFGERYAFEFSKKAYQKSGLKIDSRFLAAGKSLP